MNKLIFSVLSVDYSDNIRLREYLNDFVDAFFADNPALHIRSELLAATIQTARLGEVKSYLKRGNLWSCPKAMPLSDPAIGLNKGYFKMISVYDLKARFQTLLRPLCSSLADKGVTANQVTLAALLLSFAYGGLLALDLTLVWILLPVFLTLRMGLNAIDGMLAREHGMKSRLGMALNELGDVLADVALFIPFILHAPQAVWAIAAFIFFAVMSEFCGLLAFMMSGVRRYDGPMGKSDRAAATGILGFLIGLGFPLQSASSWIFAALAVLSIWTCFNRLNAALKE